MGLWNLRHIDEEIEKREMIVKRYRSNLNGIKGIRLNYINENVKENFAYFPIVIEESFGKTRDEVYEELKRNSIFARKYFYPITSAFECFTGRFEPEKTPVAKEMSERILTLPLYADLNIEDVDFVCEVIKNI